jgi:hypothetical protein
MKKVTKIGLTFIAILLMISSSIAQEIQRVRIDFETPNGFVRHLLLGFTPDNSANDGFDYGYDATNIDYFPNDLNWIVDDVLCVIQGVGAFEDTKKYPLSLLISNTGSFKIELKSLENFTEDINVYVYDSEEETYTRINDTFYEPLVTEIGEFRERYFIAFKEPNLSTVEIDNEENDIKYLRNSGELFFNSNLINSVEELTVYNLSGQRIINQSQIKSNRIKLNLNSSNSNVYIVHLKTTEGIISKKIII